MVRSISGIVRDMIWNPLGLAFQVGEKLASVSDPSERDVIAWISQVLERIGIDLLGKIAMESQVQDWIGVAMLALRRTSMTES